MSIAIVDLEAKSTYELETLYSAIQRRCVHFSSEVLPNQSFEKEQASQARKELKEMQDLKQAIDDVLGARIQEYLGK